MARNPTRRPPFKTIGSRYPAVTVDAVNADAERLGMTQSEWMRMAVDRLLGSEVTVIAVRRYRIARDRAETNGLVE